MKKGKYANKRSHRGATSKTLALMLSLVLIVGCVAGGTLAWLTANTSAVTNTFTESDIDVYLTESDTDTEAAGEQHNYQMIPGWTIDEDPMTWVKADSVDCYLFVKVEESANFDSYMTYEMAEGWTELKDQNGVYYRICDAGNEKGENAKYSILKDNKVSVLGAVTKDMMDAIADGTVAEPTLTFTAYASQLYKNNTETFDAAEAWANLFPSTP